MTNDIYTRIITNDLDQMNSPLDNIRPLFKNLISIYLLHEQKQQK
jgi:hypothetical protein